MEKKQKSKEFKIESERSLYNSAKIIVFIAILILSTKTLFNIYKGYINYNYFFLKYQ